MTRHEDTVEPQPEPEEQVSATPDDERSDEVAAVSPDELVPGWLAVLVLVLLLAVTALGGFVLRGVLTKDTTVTRTGFAVTEWEAKVKAAPDDVDSLLSLGYAYQQDGRFDDALEQYEQVIKLDPQNLAAYYNKGAVELELKKTKQAEATFWEVLKIAPDHALAAKALGDLYLSQKHYKSALVAVDPVLETRPDLADLQYISGFANEQLGNKEKAIERYRAAAKFDIVEARDGLRRLGAEE